MYFQRTEVITAFQSDNSWQRVVYDEFEAALTSKSRPFPCIFGAAGFQSNKLRFSFIEEISGRTAAPVLRQYLLEARNIGQYTSLVIFSKPGPALSVEVYEDNFWSFLRDLAKESLRPWPPEIPTELENPAWEFCFEGEPIFVVCNTPSHILRQSRRSSTLMITFQPRWVFDDLLGVPEVAQRSISKVRERLKPYDMIAACPHLGLYGKPDNFEYKQYFLREDNGQVECPFHTLVEHHKTNQEDQAA